MPKVPTYNRQVRPPSQLNQPRAPLSLGAEGARSIKKAGSQLQKLAQIKHEQDQTARMVAAENEYIDRSRELMNQLQQVKGEEAVAGAQGDNPGLYQKTQEELGKIRKDFRNRVQGRYADALEQRLAKIEDRHLDTAATWEATERQRWLQNQIEHSINSAELEIANAYGSPDKVGEAIQGARERIVSIHGKDSVRTKIALQALKEKLGRSAVIASMDQPDLAREYLTKYQDHLSPDVRDELDGMVKTAELKQETERWIGRHSALPFDDQLERAQEIQDPQLQKNVVAQIKSEQSIKKTIRLERQSQHYQGLWEQIMHARQEPEKNQMPSVQTLLDDPLLSVPQREHLTRMIAGEEGSDQEKRIQNRYWYELHSRINSGKNPPTKHEIMQASDQGEITPGMERSLLRELEDGEQYPSLGKAKNHLRHKLKEQTEVIGSDEDWNDFVHDLEVWARQRQQETGKAPSYDELMQMGEKLAEPEVDRSWWPFYTGSKPTPYKRETLPHYRQLIRPEGVPEDAAWSTEAGAYIFERDGQTYAMLPNGKTFRKREQSPQEQ